MYIRQNRVKARLGQFEGELGQVPNQTINIADPVDGAQLSFSGPIHEIAQVQALIGYVSGAVGAAKSNKIPEAKQALTAAKGLVAATGSQRDKASFLVNKAERFVTEKERTAASQGASAGEVLTGVGAILNALAPAGATAFQTYADSKAAKAALRGGQAPTPQYIPVPAASNNTGLIIGIVAAVAVVGLIVVMQKKK